MSFQGMEIVAETLLVDKKVWNMRLMQNAGVTVCTVGRVCDPWEAQQQQELSLHVSLYVVARSHHKNVLRSVLNNKQSYFDSRTPK